MKCYELSEFRLNASGVKCYLKTEVDAAIDELKREHHRERDEYIDWVNKLQKENSELKSMVTTDNSAVIELLSDELEKLRPMEAALEIAEADNKKYIERIKELEAENAELKRRDTEHTVHIAKMNAELRKTQRALWLARAHFCARSCAFFNGIMNRCLIGQDDLYAKCEKRKDKYLNAMYKCRAKAKEYE